ncbi:MAG: DUF6691 family protein [Gammaproteobacteria bacterium]
MKQNFLALSSGILFGFGLSLSQMIEPDKVLGFLDIAGQWDPSLAFVMLGALAVAMLSFRLVLKRPAPVFADAFHVSRKALIDRPLIFGAAIFGVGWGMTGYCPGPAVAAMGLLTPEAFIMVAAVYLGFWVHRLWFGKP